jgi:hypothetical protein
MIEGRLVRRQLNRPPLKAGYWVKLHSLTMQFVAH